MSKLNWQTPLYSQLVASAASKPQSYHVPGHRNGQVYESLRQHCQDEQRDYIEALKLLAQLDVTELSHTDDLHDPQGVIAQAQQLTAALYGAEHSFFLVGGSTAGNLALLLALCDAGDLIIVQRNVHKSIINGCKLAGAQVVFLAPEYDKETELAVIPSLVTLEQALKRHPEAKAIFFTNPNYYGLSGDLQPYIELAHDYHIPFVVDEAHGAHYGIAPHSPGSALAAGADAVVHSAHKTLPALTMGAYLHINSERISKAALQQQLAIIESSSPSYLLMASLDLARATLECYGESWFQQSYKLRTLFVEWLGSYSKSLSVKQLFASSSYRQDPYRLLLYDRHQQWSGYQLQKLIEAYGIWAEMATAEYVVLVWHMAMDMEQLEQLKQAFIGVEQQLNDTLQLNKASINRPSMSQPSVNQALAISAPIPFKRKISHEIVNIALSQAVGCVCAEPIIPYPPGIPILYEGEAITAEHIAEISYYIEAGARFQGAELLDQLLIKVFEHTL